MRITIGQDPAVCISAIFHQHDRGVGLGSTDLLNERHASFGNQACIHVGQAVDNVDRGINLDQILTDLRIHLSVSRKTEVHDRHIKLPAEDGRVNHARTTRARAVGDARSVKHDGLIPRGQWLKVAFSRDAETEKLHTVVKGQVDRIFTHARFQAGHEFHLHFLLGRSRDLHPPPRSQPDFVIHCAGLKAVGESQDNPIDYYTSNVQGSLNLLRAMDSTGCRKIIFSSSATVYGVPRYLPIDEDHPVGPVNVYGRTKA
ncbi:NAD-dependent epimerase/dehydratase family protein, partial [bacterium]|nr:NAD-dependent epimerase/dehydratase family protein [bacterium]